jgi:transcriptional repressor NrdR
MKCPYCGQLENKVIDSRLSQGGEVTRRRRECDACIRRYTTYERVEQTLPTVVKRDGRRQPFDRLKIIAGLQRAVVKRPVSAEALDRLVDALERDLADMAEREVNSTVIGEKILAALKALDSVAYVRFASVYRQFDNLDEFTGELTKLETNKDGGGTPEGG